MVKALNQVVDGLDCVIVQALLVDYHARIIVNSLADAAHEGLKLRHAPYNTLIGHFVLIVVIAHANLWLFCRCPRFCGLLEVELVGDSVRETAGLGLRGEGKKKEGGR